MSTLTTTQSTVTASLGSIVDPTRALLLFGISFDDTAPGSSQVSGNLTDGSTLTFWRDNTGSTVTIAWSVVEFSSSSGVTVQRGTTATLPGSPCSFDVTINSVNLSNAFPVISQYVSGGTYDNNDFVRAKLTGPTTLSLTTQNTGPSPGIVNWQVVEYPGATVQSGDVAFNDAVDTSMTVNPATSVTVANSLLVFTHDMGVAQNHFAQPNISGFTGSIVDANHLSFARTSADTTAGTDTITYYLVNFTDGTGVQTGTATWASTEATIAESLPAAVDTSRSVATALGRFGREGQSSCATNDVGTDNFELVLTSSDGGTDATSVQLTRGATGCGAQISWAVVEFP